MPSRYDAIPEELKWTPQWCITGADKSPHWIAGNGHLHRASVTNSNHYMQFEEAVEAACHRDGFSVGFVLTATDPYTCIDLDVKEDTTAEQLARFEKIVATFNSFTELSRSGKGLHIWVRGSIGAGCRRDGVEVYSQERFIIFTGNVYRNLPVEPRQELLNVLIAEIGNADAPSIKLVETGEIDADSVIYERAAGAENSSKFLALWKGDWKEIGYPSQSEADLSLMSMLTFYSKSNEQCRRLFRLSGLGKREKATKNNAYLDRTLATIRGRQERDDVIEKVTAASAANLMAALNKKQAAIETVPPVVLPEPAPKEHTELDEPLDEIPGLEWPPGLAGALAWYIYQASPRPVKEVSIVAALGLLAGIVGKTYLIPESGLNVYIVLVARSGVGKEAMHSGIANIMSRVRESVPGAMNFIDFSDYASGPALSKAVAANPSFVNIVGEFGHILKRLANEKSNDSAMHSLRKCMTNLYQKSGPTSVVGGIGYSDKEKNVASVSGVAYSMIGETTPGVFYESLSESMMEDGFLSRFTIVDYMGERPPENSNLTLAPHPGLLNAMVGLCLQSLTLIGRFQNQKVERDKDAAKILNDFNLHCDAKINSTHDEARRQMWNRAHLKSYRFAAILAAADNPINPCITEAHAQWALVLVNRDIHMISKKLESGDIGSGDAQREKKLLSLIRSYQKKPIPVSYSIPDAVRKEGLIPHRLLLLRIPRLKCFTDHRLGATTALEQTLKSLLTSGYLAETDAGQTVKKHGYHGKVYRVVYLPLDVE